VAAVRRGAWHGEEEVRRKQLLLECQHWIVDRNALSFVRHIKWQLKQYPRHIGWQLTQYPRHIGWQLTQYPRHIGWQLTQYPRHIGWQLTQYPGHSYENANTVDR
jgi:hypothetical protein